jgi:hypothetical protein
MSADPRPVPWEDPPENPQARIVRSPRSGAPLDPATFWKPGQSGNPGGRPKLHVPVSEAMTRLLNGEPLPPKPRKKSWDVAAALIKRAQAAAGKNAAYAGTATEQILERTEGKVPGQVTPIAGLIFNFVFPERELPLSSVITASALPAKADE